MRFEFLVTLLMWVTESDLRCFFVFITGRNVLPSTNVVWVKLLKKYYGNLKVQFLFIIIFEWISTPICLIFDTVKLYFGQICLPNATCFAMLCQAFKIYIIIDILKRVLVWRSQICLWSSLDKHGLHKAHVPRVSRVGSPSRAAWRDNHGNID